MSKTGRRLDRVSPSRMLAYQLVEQVNQHGAYANLRLPELLRDSTLERRDRAFVTELAYGTLRMQGKHDYVIQHHSSRPLEEIGPELLNVLRLGIHQLHEMRVEQHAAVSESVELAKYLVGEGRAAFVNAILRSVTRDSEFFNNLSARDDLSDDEKIAIQYSHPLWLIPYLRESLSDEPSVIAFMKSNNVPATPTLIAWPGRSDLSELVESGAVGIEGTRAATFAGDPQTVSAISQGRAGVQDRGSQMIVEAFFATHVLGSASSWLDLCAGPGGKAAYLDSLLATQLPDSTLVANEPTPHRAQLVERVVRRARVTSHDGRAAGEFDASFDRILIDAPCTGIGALRRRPEARWRKNVSDMKSLIQLQRELISAGLSMLAPGGILGYATCSPLLGETQRQILEIRHVHKDLEVLPISQFIDLPDGAQTPDGSMQLWTHLHQTDSMFFTLLRRKG